MFSFSKNNFFFLRVELTCLLEKKITSLNQRDIEKLVYITNRHLEKVRKPEKPIEEWDEAEGCDVDVLEKEGK